METTKTKLQHDTILNTPVLMQDELDALGKPRRCTVKNIPFVVRQKINGRIAGMPHGRDKDILWLHFYYGLSTTQIEKNASRWGLYSRNHKLISRRRIQQVIEENIPEYNQYQRKNTAAKKERFRFNLAQKEKKRGGCAWCKSTENLELHHMIPVAIGGTNDERNCVVLCRNCHQTVTKYQKQLFPDVFRSYKNKITEGDA